VGSCGVGGWLRIWRAARVVAEERGCRAAAKVVGPEAAKASGTNSGSAGTACRREAGNSEKRGAGLAWGFSRAVGVRELIYQMKKNGQNWNEYAHVGFGYCCSTKSASRSVAHQNEIGRFEGRQKSQECLHQLVFMGGFAPAQHHPLASEGRGNPGAPGAPCQASPHIEQVIACSLSRL
jgi:hypothetical protein